MKKLISAFFLVLITTLSPLRIEAADFTEIIRLGEPVSGQEVIDAVRHIVGIWATAKEKNEGDETRHDYGVVNQSFEIEDQKFHIIGRRSARLTENFIVGVGEKYNPNYIPDPDAMYAVFTQYYIDPEIKYLVISIAHTRWGEFTNAEKSSVFESDVFKSLYAFRQELENELRK